MSDIVEPFIVVCAQSKAEAKQISYSDGTSHFILKFDPKQMFLGGSHPAYDVALSPIKNPIMNSLDAKADQLRGAPSDAIRLVVLCDAGCATMNQSRSSNIPKAFSARQISEEFLRRSTVVDFVVLATIRNKSTNFRAPNYHLEYDLICRRQKVQHLSRVDASTINAIRDLFADLMKFVPVPVLDPYNALIRCNNTGVGSDMIANYTWSANRIKISSRALHRLLAGEISSKDFLSAHGWDHDKPPDLVNNPFRRLLMSGRMIEKMTVETLGDKDDDFIEFEFGPFDAAAGHFLTISQITHDGALMNNDQEEKAYSVPDDDQ